MAEAESQPFGPPHTILDPIAFPRVWANEQPSIQRATFSEFYPNGLPIVYKMVSGANAVDVAQAYLEDNLPVGFFTNAPSKAKALFSTVEGSRPFRRMHHILPARNIHLWNKNEIQVVCNSIRQVFWHLMRQMLQPFCWDDLWTYFDAFDLYRYGALNLWNVINHLVDENKIIYADLMKEAAVQAGQWTDAWLAEETNKAKLRQWDPSSTSVLQLFNANDWLSLGNINDDITFMIASALRARRDLLMGNDNEQATSSPTDLVSAVRDNNLQNWLAGAPRFHPNGLPPTLPAADTQMTKTTAESSPTSFYVHNGNHYFLPPPNPRLMNQTGPAMPNQAVQQLKQSAKARVNKPSQTNVINGIVIADGTSKTALKASSRLPVGSVRKSKETVSKAVDSDNLFPDGQSVTDLVANIDPNPMHIRRKRSDSTPPIHPNRLSWKYPRRNIQSARLVTVSQPVPLIPEDAALDDDSVTDPGGASPSTVSSCTLPEKNANAPIYTGESTGKAHDNVSQADNALPQPIASAAPPFEHHQSQLRFPLASQVFQPAQSRPETDENHPGALITGVTPESGPQPFSSGMSPFPFGGEKAHIDAASGIVSAQNSHQSRHGDSLHTSMIPVESLAGISYLPNSMTPDAWNYNAGQRKLEPQTTREPIMDHARPEISRKGGRKHFRNSKDMGRKWSNASKNGSYDSQQPFNSSFPAPPKHTWRRQSNVSQQSLVPEALSCPNRSPQSPGKPYFPCDCDHCGRRNRSVMAEVVELAGYDDPQVCAHLKQGFESRYGPVEEVHLLNGNCFVVRFTNEAAVNYALHASQGTMPECRISVMITPIQRTKWTAWPKTQDSGRSLNMPLLSASYIGYPQSSVNAPTIMPATGFMQSPSMIGPAMHPVSLPAAPTVTAVHVNAPPMAHYGLPSQGHQQHDLSERTDPSLYFPSHLRYTPAQGMTHVHHNNGELQPSPHVSSNRFQIEPRPEINMKNDQRLLDLWQGGMRSSPSAAGRKQSSKSKARTSSPTPSRKQHKQPQVASSAQHGSHERDSRRAGNCEAPSRAKAESPKPVEGTKNSIKVKDQEGKTTHASPEIPLVGKPDDSGKGKISEQSSIIDTEESATSAKQSSASKFTDEEIKGRKKASNRIPMPINPWRPKDSMKDDTEIAGTGECTRTTSPNVLSTTESFVDLSSHKEDHCSNTTSHSTAGEQATVPEILVREASTAPKNGSSPSNNSTDDGAVLIKSTKEKSPTNQLNDGVRTHSRSASQPASASVHSKKVKTSAGSSRDNESRVEAEHGQGSKSGRSTPRQLNRPLVAPDTLHSSNTGSFDETNSLTSEKQQAGTSKRKSRKKNKKPSMSKPALKQDKDSSESIDSGTTTPASTMTRTQGSAMSTIVSSRPTPIGVEHDPNERAPGGNKLDHKLEGLVAPRPLPYPPISKRSSSGDCSAQAADATKEGKRAPIGTVKLQESDPPSGKKFDGTQKGDHSSLRLPKRGKKGAMPFGSSRFQAGSASDSITDRPGDGLPTLTQVPEGEDVPKQAPRGTLPKKDNLKHLTDIFIPPSNDQLAKTSEDSSANKSFNELKQEPATDVKPDNNGSKPDRRAPKVRDTTPGSPGEATEPVTEKRRNTKASKSPARDKKNSPAQSEAKEEATKATPKGKSGLSEQEWPSLSSSSQRVNTTASPTHTWSSKARAGNKMNEKS